MAPSPNLATILVVVLYCSTAMAAEWKAEQTIDVAPVWSGHPVRFCLLTHGEQQFVAFYNAERQMTVGVRKLDSDKWHFVELPQRVGWDSHNSITMTTDDDGHIHLSGNMHCVPLIYFRTKNPLDIDSFERVPAMVGSNERRCTYPVFLRGAKGELIFTYRDGGSGNGNQIWNVYDLKTKKWRRLLDQPLFSGEGKMNAYFNGPIRDKDGVFHVCWVWRDTPDCATNHHLCYVRSKNLIDWEKSDAAPLKLPITLGTAEVVDPVPPGGGMINGNARVGFDSQGRVVIAYHKFDADGKTQLYNARREKDGWKIYQTSDWDYRWEFHGGGSIPFEIRVGTVTAAPDGTLTQSYRHDKLGSGRWRIDEKTLKPLGKASPEDKMPGELFTSETGGMQSRTCGDAGQSGDPNVRYLLRWQTWPVNRDRAHRGNPPEPTMMRLYKLRKK